MRLIRVSWPALLILSGCLAARTQRDAGEISTALAEATRRPPEGATSSTRSEEESLAQETRLDPVLRIAVARNPDLGETAERVRAALERVRSSARLPDLELKYEQWAVPLARPYALNEASTIMIGLRQQFPAPGSLQARARAALEDAGIALQNRRAKQLDIVAQARKAYYDYYRADREYKIHLEHVALASDVVELARANYRVGRGTQQDVLRAIVELSKLHNDVAAIEQQRISARVLLNTLMARAPGAPLGPVPNFKTSDVEPRLDDLERQLEARRPELVAAGRAIRRSEAQLAAAKSTRNWPSFMVGADYWFQPTAQTPAPQHAYSGMLSITLPWINPKHWEDVREAEHTLLADRRALESVRNVSLYQLHDAAARLSAVRQSLAIIERDLLPQAQQSFEATRASFSAGQGDAVALLDSFRSYLDVRLQHERALAVVEMSLADLARAAGAESTAEGTRK